MVNQIALASLPADFPAFVREPANAERIAFLAVEPDRWKNVPDLPLRHSGGSWSDHFFDMEQIPLAGLDFATLPSFRFDFVVRFAAGRAAHADRFPVINPDMNPDHTLEWPGFSPWAITEYFGRLRSAFSYLKVLEELGSAEEVANARANAVYLMGIMGHYVGDGAQPLHTTNHFDGWVGPNPNGYTTKLGIHSWMDSGLINKARINFAALAPRVAPAQAIALGSRADGRDPMFVAVLDYLLEQFKLVEPLYQLEKEGKLSNKMEKEGRFHQDKEPVNAEGRAFVEGQLLKGGNMLGAIWLTAWKQAVPDTFLRSRLVWRRASESASPAVPR